MAAPDPSSVRLTGPWTHRDVFANGISLHVAEAGGDGPLVVLLHGFAENWWVWHHQLVDLADAGYRVVAVDLRGYGDSDKPPRGYDGWTLAGDIAGLVRALGERSAHLVGHAWGGFLAWTAATLHPRVAASVTVLGAGHPLAFRAAIRHGWYRRSLRPQFTAAAHLFRFQPPITPERTLVADRAAEVERYLRAWSAAEWTSTDEFTEVSGRLREAMLIPGVAHSALEYYRWAFRSQFRGDGRRFKAAVDAVCPAPVFQLHGGEDRCIVPATARASTRWARERSWLHVLPGVGHYPHLEAPAQTGKLLQSWLTHLASE